MEIFNDMLIIKVRVKSMRYFQSMPLEFDMARISSRISFALLDRRTPKARLAREVGVSRDLVYNYTRENFPEESMRIPVLKAFAEYFKMDTYYFCNDYHKFMDQTDVAELLKSIRRKKGVTQKMFADELGVALAIYKAYEQGKSNLPYQVYLRLQKVYGPFEDNLWEVEVNERKL